MNAIEQYRGLKEVYHQGRYTLWTGDLGTSILSGDASLASLEGQVAAGGIEPRPSSGRQELLENLVNRQIWAADRPDSAS